MKCVGGWSKVKVAKANKDQMTLLTMKFNSPDKYLLDIVFVRHKGDTLVSPINTTNGKITIHRR